mmetsp:Transcript_93815/g.195696  ORF Transcript_93815/g.195696 Transcript_93815/m.195696 type:complete len:1305 (+) Transcript_93815:133-4047(+)
MTTSSVWDPNAANFEMQRKASFSLFSTGDPSERPMPKGSGDTHEKLWALMQSYKANDVESVQKDIVAQVEYSLACTRFSFSKEDAYRATSLAVRDRLLESFNDTNDWYREKDVKRAYYLSAEYLLGRAFQNALVNLDLEPPFKDALTGLGFELEELYPFEADPGLGNGGLGRLAACFLDSMATLSLPCWGYGIRYSYGIFKQDIIDGWQVEKPDYWLAKPVPWEIPRPDVTYPVRFGGRIEDYSDDKGCWRTRWVGGEIIQAMAYDNPIPGFDTYNTNNLRLWRALPSEEFDFQAFNEFRYSEAVDNRRKAEDLSAVLYPNDDEYEGKLLRLKQQYFFVSASLQDLLREFIKKPDRQWSELPKKVAVQMNDTHPTMAVLEMMRLLVDVQRLSWDEAWELTKKTCNYTNHTVMPEALEKWPVDMMQELLPRHLNICGEINKRFMEELTKMYGDGPKVWGLSLFQEEPFKGIRMGNIAVLGSNKINGVAALHTEIVKKETFADFYQYYLAKGEKDKFVNMTNGVTPRRWVHCANRPLSDLYTKYLGSHKWLVDMNLLKALQKKKDDPAMQKEWMAAKRQAKERLVAYLKGNNILDADPDTLFDCQFKRIHEYKRQLLNCFYIIYRYMQIKQASPSERSKFQKRTCLIGGKAAPAYQNAKTIIKLVGNIGKIVNNDPDVSPYLKVAFVPNYSVTAAQAIIPASDISEHISTAGTEASGTSNMKFVMNGGLIIGTMDGANIEIREEGGEDTMFIFGCLETDVPGIKEKAAAGTYPIDGRLQKVFDTIKSGTFSLGDDVAHGKFCGLVDKLCNITAAGTWEGDRYLLINDFPSYVAAQEKVDKTYADQSKWCALSIQAATSMAQFSTDRTISEYAKVIWGIESSPRPAPVVRSASKSDLKEAAAPAPAPAAAPKAEPKASPKASPKAAPKAEPKPEEPEKEKEKEKSEEKASSSTAKEGAEDKDKDKDNKADGDAKEGDGEGKKDDEQPKSSEKPAVEKVELPMDDDEADRIVMERKRQQQEARQRALEAKKKAEEEMQRKNDEELALAKRLEEEAKQQEEARKQKAIERKKKEEEEAKERELRRKRRDEDRIREERRRRDEADRRRREEDRRRREREVARRRSRSRRDRSRSRRPRRSRSKSRGRGGAGGGGGGDRGRNRSRSRRRSRSRQNGASKDGARRSPSVRRPRLSRSASKRRRSRSRSHKKDDTKPGTEEKKEEKSGDVPPAPALPAMVPPSSPPPGEGNTDKPNEGAGEAGGPPQAGSPGVPGGMEGMASMVMQQAMIAMQMQQQDQQTAAQGGGGAPADS